MRLPVVFAVAALGAALWGATVAAPSPDRPSPSPDRGLYVFQAYCAACHGEEGRGDGPMAAKLFNDFGVRPTDLAGKSFHSSRTDEQLAQAVRGGGQAVHRTPFMPAWGTTLTDRQVVDLVSFLRELEGGDLGPRPSMVSVQDELELGRVLYGIHCLACHGRSGRGDGPFLTGMLESGGLNKVPPDLSAYAFYADRSDSELGRAVRSGLTHAGLTGRDSDWWHRQLDDHEVRAIIFYLRALPLLPEEQSGLIEARSDALKRGREVAPELLH